MNRTRVEEILNRFSGQTILIVGDVMLDEFIWGKVRRISPEAPVPVVEVVDETYRLGGSGNVAANIQELDGKAIPIGIVGRDAASDRIGELLEKAGIETHGLVRADRPTTLKTRILAHSQQVVRADRESRKPLSAELNADLAMLFTQFLPEAAAVIVSDYDKGVVNPDLMAAILPMARSEGIPVFLDPKVHHADYYRPITLITPNHREAELLTGMAIDSEPRLEEAGRKLLQKFACEYALITRGEEGMSLFSNASSHHLPTFAREVFDVTGAGDTVIAALALARAGGAAMEEAAILANHAAGIVVGKVGTATVTRAELVSDFEARDAHFAG
ncbi:MAG TPA: D-glycero-beta-D-manno-heptose-7-phosphate kinase [Terriglobia bacterium]|jgi:D-beta-D-heptose 7-phosphate kinase/D-beta-D-heptose 1-phosphate adenosyltransferase